MRATSNPAIIYPADSGIAARRAQTQQDTDACLRLSRGFSHAALGSLLQTVAFHERLGFIAEGDAHIEAGIPHRFMRPALPNTDGRS